MQGGSPSIDAARLIDYVNALRERDRVERKEAILRAGAVKLALILTKGLRSRARAGKQRREQQRTLDLNATASKKATTEGVGGDVLAVVQDSPTLILLADCSWA
jgi:hypothetical protein